ncbi:MAG: hypothetical protein GYB66_13915, partial [Chloroflexi bacterium]|nr:hypothetical protein [Chloroflexota bacterium]
STALLWVSRRAKVDLAVQAGKPADRETVAAILREDPTLSEDLRITYSRHLLSICLALEEWATTSVVPVVAASHRDVAEAIFEQLRDASRGEQARRIYELIEYWLTTVPEANSLPWQQVLYIAALSYLHHLRGTRDDQAAAAMVFRFCNAPEVLQIDRVATRLINEMRSVAPRSPELAQAVLILGADYLSAGAFQDLISDINLVKQLPHPQQRALALLQEDVVANFAHHRNTLSEAVDSLPEAFRPLLLMRLIEIALYRHRPELVGERDLRALLQIASLEQVDRYRHVVKYLVDELSKPHLLPGLTEDAWAILAQMLFLIDDPDAGVQLLEYYQNELYTLDRLPAFTEMVHKVFREAPLDPARTLAALNSFHGTKIRIEPRVRALCDSLINHNWDQALEPVANEMTDILSRDNRLVSVIGVNNTVQLLAFHAAMRHKTETLTMASVLVDVAIQIGRKGPVLLVDAWQYLTWQPDVLSAGVELLRRYIRRLPPEQTHNLPAYFAQHLGSDIGDALAATRLMRIVSDGHDLVDLTEMIRLASDLFFDMAVTYYETKDPPSMHRLRSELDGMPGNLSETERYELTKNLMAIARLVYDMGMLADASRRSSGKDAAPPRAAQAIRQTNPLSGAEFLQWLGVQFTDTVVESLDLVRQEASHLLGVRGVAVLYREAAIIRRLLECLQTAFQPGVAASVSAAALEEEVVSLWNQIRLYDQERIAPVLAASSQQLALLLPYLAGRVSARVLADKGLGNQLEAGKRQPQTEIEAMRWISGYFGRKHQR